MKDFADEISCGCVDGVQCAVVDLDDDHDGEVRPLTECELDEFGLTYPLV